MYNLLQVFEPHTILMKKPHKKECVEALHALLAHFGTKAEMARQASMSRNTVSYWFTRGQVGRQAAIKFGKMKSVPFTKEQLRPDVVNWTPVAKR
jgi:hypothetical protein